MDLREGGGGRVGRRWLRLEDLEEKQEQRRRFTVGEMQEMHLVLCDAAED